MTLLEHLDWSSDRPSPFISTSRDREWVRGEARRREQAGHTNVRMYEISINDEDLNDYERRHGRLYWKGVMRWLDLAQLGIPRYADFEGTRNEYLFLHHIPVEFIHELDW
jgi:hypothetical protein